MDAVYLPRKSKNPMGRLIEFENPVRSPEEITENVEKIHSLQGDQPQSIKNANQDYNEVIISTFINELALLKAHRQ